MKYKSEWSAASLASVTELRYCVAAIADRIRMMAMTISSSIRVQPASDVERGSRPVSLACKWRTALSPVLVLAAVERFPVGLREDVVHVAAAPRGGLRIVARRV